MKNDWLSEHNGYYSLDAFGGNRPIGYHSGKISLFVGVGPPPPPPPIPYPGNAGAGSTGGNGSSGGSGYTAAVFSVDTRVTNNGTISGGPGGPGGSGGQGGGGGGGAGIGDNL